MPTHFCDVALTSGPPEFPPVDASIDLKLLNSRLGKHARYITDVSRNMTHSKWETHESYFVA